jgi:hypothetical protein
VSRIGAPQFRQPRRLVRPGFGSGLAGPGSVRSGLAGPGSVGPGLAGPGSIGAGAGGGRGPEAGGGRRGPRTVGSSAARVRVGVAVAGIEGLGMARSGMVRLLPVPAGHVAHRLRRPGGRRRSGRRRSGRRGGPRLLGGAWGPGRLRDAGGPLGALPGVRRSAPERVLLAGTVSWRGPRAGRRWCAVPAGRLLVIVVRPVGPGRPPRLGRRPPSGPVVPKPTGHADRVPKHTSVAAPGRTGRTFAHDR